jgi:type I restriction enzyme R subunit
LQRHYLSEEREQQVRKAFRDPDALPKLLLVTEKLLTGYDAPILYGMYLDKPMRDHVLLQAIARVNRPYEDEAGRRKPAGFVLDFVGIFEKLERALAFDSEDVAGVIEGLDVLQRRFADLIAQGGQDYLPIPAGLAEDKAAEAVLEHFRDKEVRHEFYTYYRELEELYEILSPDPFLRPYLRDYEALTRMYRLLRAGYEPHLVVDKSLLRKTAALVQRHTQALAIREPQAVYRLDTQTLEAIAAEHRPDTVKVFNLLKAFHDLVAEQGRLLPHLIPIGERAREIAAAFEERQLTTQEALAALEALVRQYREAEASPQRQRLTPAGFAVYWLLRYEGVDGAEGVADEATATFNKYPHWTRSRAQEREVRRELYRSLLRAQVPRVVEFATRLLTVLRKAEA